MTDIENELREALRDAVANRPSLGPIDADAVVERSRTKPALLTSRHGPRWLAAAAALALVAGIGVAAVSLSQNGRAIPAVPAATPTPGQAGSLALVGTAWTAISIRGEVTRPDSTGTLPYLSFDTATEVTNEGSCHFKAGYRLIGDELSFFTLDTLDPDCGNPGSIDQHREFDAALQATKSARRTGDRLDLIDQAGATIVTLEATTVRSSGPAPTSTGTSTAHSTRVRVYNAAGRDFGNVSLRPRTGDPVQLGELRAETESRLVAVPFVDDQAVIVGTADGTVYTFRMDAYRGEADWKAGDYTYTVFADGAGRDFFSFSGWSSPPRQPEPLQARVRNDSSLTFDHVLVRFADGAELEQDGLAPGATTAAVSTGWAYAYTYADVTVDGRHYRWAPIDNVGESPLATGRYVWALDLAGDELRMQVEADR